MKAQQIVVVEDEGIVALDIRRKLERLGYEVPAVFQSGEELLDALPGLSADLVFMDIALSGRLDGVETAQRVKQEFNLPVILLTALDGQDVLDRAKMAQPLAFIAKPFDERDLRNAVVISLYRHSMEQTLQERERLFATTLESIQDGVLVTDDDFRIEYSNSVAAHILGCPMDTLRGALLDDVLTVHDEHGRVVRIDAEEDSQLYAHRPDETSVAVERYVAPLVSNGTRTGWVVVIHDVSERLAHEEQLRRNEEQLRSSQKMEAIGRLTGGIAHDFNNLLTVILGYSKLLGEEIDSLPVEANLDPLRSDLEGIQKAAIRSAALTRQLLAFSSHRSVERRVVDVNEVVMDMEKMLVRLVSDDVQTRVDLVAQDALVRMDPSQLEQVIMNLAVNARDAMPDGGRIMIRTEVRDVDVQEIGGHEGVVPGRFVAIVVRDTGVGMSPDTIDRIFEPFFTTKDVGQGTGLGLSTVYGIVTQSGGYLNVESKPGGGTTFTVYLPLQDSPQAASMESAPHAQHYGGSETLLLVEDEEDIRVLLSRVLRERGYQVLEAANAGEALLLHEQHRDAIAMLVTDVVMPHLSGPALADRLLEIRPSLRVLFVSAYSEGHITDDHHRNPDYRYMQKPVDPTRFVARIRAILDE